MRSAPAQCLRAARSSSRSGGRRRPAARRARRVARHAPAEDRPVALEGSGWRASPARWPSAGRSGRCSSRRAADHGPAPAASCRRRVGRGARRSIGRDAFAARLRRRFECDRRLAGVQRRRPGRRIKAGQAHVMNDPIPACAADRPGPRVRSRRAPARRGNIGTERTRTLCAGWPFRQLGRIRPRILPRGIARRAGGAATSPSRETRRERRLRATARIGRACAGDVLQRPSP
jgi:hypothetical protein